MQSSNQLTLLQAIKQDHREIEAFYSEYEKNTGNVDQQERWANQFTWEVARHSISEELVVYPLLEKELGEKGRVMAQNDRSDHQYVKDRLKNIEHIKVGSAEHASVLKDVMDHLNVHIKEEEEVDFPQLENALGMDRSVHVAKNFERTKMFVPTRSHPSAPSKPPFETLAGLLAAPIDKLKDAFSKFPTAEQRERVTAEATGKN